jgi:hypothetical protein
MESIKLNPTMKFVTIAMLKSALIIYEMEKTKDEWLQFSEEIWETMLLSNPDELFEDLQAIMEFDLDEYLEKLRDEADDDDK